MSLLTRSRYTVTTKTENGSILLYNSLSGAVASVGKEKANLIKDALKLGVSEESSIGKQLLKGGFVVQKNEDETKKVNSLYFNRYRNTKNLHLILMSTEQCNFRCIYCYEHFKREEMPLEIQNGVFNYVSKIIDSLDSISVEWFGGEPLLASEVVLNLGERLYKLALSKNKLYSATVTTNGYFLTPDLVKKLLEIGISHYTVTLDGVSNQHDKRRILRDGSPTFHTIINNLESLKNTDWNFRVKFRNNYDPESLSQLDDFLKFLKKEFGNDKRFADVNMRPIGKWGGPEDDSLVVCDKAEGISERWEVLRKAMHYGFPENDLKYYIQPGKYVCYASDPMSFAIGSDGKIMKCTLELDSHDRNVVGQVKEDGYWDIDFEKLATWVMGDGHADEVCKSCYFAPACQGAACAKARFDTGIRPCPSEKKEIAHVLRLIYEQDILLKMYPSNIN